MCVRCFENSKLRSDLRQHRNRRHNDCARLSEGSIKGTLREHVALKMMVAPGLIVEVMAPALDHPDSI
jgi:hypothetical protein